MISTIMDEIINLCRENFQDKEVLRDKLYVFLNKYDIKEIPRGTTHPDIKEKITLFVMAKRTEGLSDHTLKNYGKVLNDFGTYIQKTIETITSNDIRLWLANHQGLKMSTFRYYVSVLRSFFDHLIAEEIIDIDPMRKIKMPKIPKTMPKALNLDELEVLREGCITLREKAILEAFYATGGRLQEIHDMNKRDINWQERTIRVIGKGNKERPVFINSRAVFALKKYLNSREDTEQALFVTEKGKVKRLAPRSIQAVFKKITLRSALDKNIHPHIMRHTMATTMVNHGARLEDVQGILGHSSPNTTQIYAQVNIHRRKEAYLRSFR